MICELTAWTLFAKEDNIEKEKLYKLLKIYPVTLKLTTSSHLSYDLARLMTWFGNGDYNYYIDSRKDAMERDIIYFEINELMAGEE